MKLITKIISSVAPISLLGVITPAIVSCSCAQNTFSIEYGQDINCLNKKDKKTYHSIKKIKSAVNAKINVETERGKEIVLNDLNSKLLNDGSAENQNIYFEFVYYYSNNRNGFTLMNWKFDETNQIWTFNWSEKPDITEWKLKYTVNEETSKICVATDDDILFESKTYALCVAK